MIERSQYTVETPDGWELVVARRRIAAPPPELPLAGEPLLLVHGFSQNRHAWLSGRLVKTLVAQGVDVHLAELRGHGRSSIEHQRRRHARTGRPLPPDLDYGWDIDALALHDIPSLVAAVARSAGRKRIFYAGHSLGGVLGYVHASRTDDLEGLITLGAAVEIGRDSWPVRIAAHVVPMVLGPVEAALAIGKAARRLRRSPPAPEVTVPMDAFLQGYGWLLAAEGTHDAYGWLCAQAGDLVLLSNPRRVDRSAVRRLLRIGGEKESRRVLSQLAGWARRGRIELPRLGIDLAQSLSQIRVPLLVLYGEADKLAKRRGTELAAQAVKSSYVRTHGLEGHGHLELTMGLHTDVIAGHIAELMLHARHRRTEAGVDSLLR